MLGLIFLPFLPCGSLGNISDFTDSAEGAENSMRLALPPTVPYSDARGLGMMVTQNDLQASELFT